MRCLIKLLLDIRLTGKLSLKAEESWEIPESHHGSQQSLNEQITTKTTQYNKVSLRPDVN
jgi:hypothetical protein